MRTTDNGSSSPEARQETRPEPARGGSVPAAWPGSGRPISSKDLERIIRRASDLQFRSGSGSDEGALAEHEVVRIGEEVGLEPRYVRQALAEMRAESLLPRVPAESPLARRLWGPGLLRASRVVPGGRGEVEARLDRHFRERELLQRVRSQPGRSLWEPAGGLLSSMKRAMNIGGHGYELAKARSVEVSVEPLESGWSLVTLTADLRNERAAAAAGWHLSLGLAGLAGAVSLLALVGPELPILLASGGAGAGGIGAASWATSLQFRRRRRRAELALQGLLDRLERGELV